MKKLTLLIAMFVIFNITTSYSWSVTVPSTTPANGICQNGTINIHVNTNDIFDVFEIRIINSGGVQVGYFCPVVPSGIFGSGNYNADRTVNTLWSGNYTIQVWELNLGGCGDRNVLNTAGATVGQTGILVDNPSTPVGSTTPCPLSWSSYSTYASGAASYQWYLSPSAAGSISGNGSSGFVSWDTSFHGMATVSVTASDACGGVSQVSGLSIFQNGLVGNPSTPSGPATICNSPNSTTSYTSSATNALDYFWYLSPASAGSIASNSTTGLANWNPAFQGAALIHVDVNDDCGFLSSQAISVQVNIPLACDPPYSTNLIQPSAPGCADGQIWFSNGDSFYNLDTGNHTFSGTYQCACDTIPYSIDMYIGSEICYLNLVTNVDYIGTCSANISGTVFNLCNFAQVYLYKKSDGSLVDSQYTSPGFVYGYFNFNNLKNGKYYIVANNSGCTETNEITITGIQCLPPTNEISIPQSNTKVRLKWDTVACADGYIIRYKPVGSTKYKTRELYTNTNKTSFDNLLTNTNYEWNIRTKCATGKKSDFSSTYNFCVGNNCLGARLTKATENLADELKLYPNPAKDVLQISLPDFETDNVQLQITNNMGQLMLSKSLTGNNITDQSINLESFANGIYQLNVIANDNNYAARFIVAK